MQSDYYETKAKELELMARLMRVPLSKQEIFLAKFYRAIASDYRKIEDRPYRG